MVGSEHGSSSMFKNMKGIPIQIREMNCLQIITEKRKTHKAQENYFETIFIPIASPVSASNLINNKRPATSVSIPFNLAKLQNMYTVACIRDRAISIF